MSAPDPADLAPMALRPRKHEMTADGVRFRDLLFTMGPGDPVSAVRLRGWFDEHQVPPQARPGLFMGALGKGWIESRGEFDRYPSNHPRKGAWCFKYRVTGKRDGATP